MISTSCLSIFPVLSYLKACSSSFKTFSGKTLSFKLILRNVCLYKQPNVTMTLEHIMQTRSTQSILRRVLGFNCFKFSLAYSETGKLLNKPRML
jgi:hypothetical protein